VTWVEWAVVLLVCERLCSIAWGTYRGVKAVWERRQQIAAITELADLHRLNQTMRRFSAGRAPHPDYVEIASEEPVALDYSSGPKRH
jgi:hypothetical protein